MLLSYTWDTTELCKVFNIPETATVISETYEAIPTGTPFIGGMTGVKHSEETKKKMSKSAPRSRPHLHRGGKIIKDGDVYEFTCLSHACKELNLSVGHLSELMSGKRHTVKGWRKYG